MKAWLSLLELGVCGMLLAAAMARGEEWRPLAAIPDEEGFAGCFAGVSGGALLVAGGANIVGDRWSDSPTKKWYDAVYVLPEKSGKWQIAGKLPRALGYGVSVTTASGVLCWGGSDAERHYRDGFCLSYEDGELKTTSLPPLPEPCANACAALVGRVVYVAGGISSPAATSAGGNIWALNLEAAEPQWEVLPTWPGAPRMLAVAGSSTEAFYLFSGVALEAGPDGRPVREYLRDAYCYRPSVGWTRLPDLPRAAAAAPSPAVFHQGRFLIFSGDDGVNVSFQPVREHPGFPRTRLEFAIGESRWIERAESGRSWATVPMVRWGDDFVVPNGEVRPRVRTPAVWARRP